MGYLESRFLYRMRNKPSRIRPLCSKILLQTFFGRNKLAQNISAVFAYCFHFNGKELTKRKKSLHVTHKPPKAANEKKYLLWSRKWHSCCNRRAVPQSGEIQNVQERIKMQQNKIMSMVIND